jgi:hypothetical protein
LIKGLINIKNFACQENFERFLENARISEYADYRTITDYFIPPFSFIIDERGYPAPMAGLPI